jgi:hypothetical protein
MLCLAGFTLPKKTARFSRKPLRLGSKKDRFSWVSIGPTDPRKKVPVNRSVSLVFWAGFFLSKKPTGAGFVNLPSGIYSTETTLLDFKLHP